MTFELRAYAMMSELRENRAPTPTRDAGHHGREMPPVLHKLALWTLVLSAACSRGSSGPLEVSGAPPRTVFVALDQELRIRLQTIGPGEYVSPPTVTGPALLFVSVGVVGPSVPAGPTQEFRFRAVSRGQAIIEFHHTQSNPVVSDTVIVR
ncbi:MAG: hypothetical protein Q8K82_12905 [Gemmatimonadaceae bacterium]|nr:hypothetical protein [Gemmatimonadaceae bacterium]